MSHEEHLKIIEECLALDTMAIRFYKAMAGSSRESVLQSLWRNMLNDEKEHVCYWKKLLNYARTEKVPPVFDQPARILEELRDLHNTVNPLIEQAGRPQDTASALLMCYQIEFYLMHPAFGALFHILGKKTGDMSAEQGYADHIGRIQTAVEKLGDRRPEFRIIAGLMDRLWTAHYKQALQLADIRALQNLIPICMHCKKVRNDEGFWDKVETYVGRHFHADFSHGICPECMVKYYPEYADDEPVSGKSG